MNDFVICNEEKIETKQLGELSRKKLGLLSDEWWNIEEGISLIQLEQLVKERENMDVLYMDVLKEGALALTEEIRKESQEMALLVIADKDMHPACYVNPKIHADSLLIRPFTREEAKERIEELWDMYMLKHDGEKAWLHIKVDRESTRLPYAKIMYIESRNGKVEINLEHEKYTVDMGLKEIEERLPEETFVRVHRGFILNRRMIQSIDMTERIIRIKGEGEIPFSRSYRSIVKELKYQYAF